MNLTRDERLVLLIEECGEVIQAATKCLRFGFDREFPGYGRNDIALARECGELSAVVDSIDLPLASYHAGRDGKIARAVQAKKQRALGGAAGTAETEK